MILYIKDYGDNIIRVDNTIMINDKNNDHNHNHDNYTIINCNYDYNSNY